MPLCPLLPLSFNPKQQKKKEKRAITLASSFEKIKKTKKEEKKQNQPTWVHPNTDVCCQVCDEIFHLAAKIMKRDTYLP